MVTGISIDFHKMEIAWVSEVSQWWSSMATAVIFGLTLATILTLVVVPSLYSLFDSLKVNARGFIRWIRKIYWIPYYKITGEHPSDF